MFLTEIATSKNSRQLKEKILNKKEWKPNENVICNIKSSEQILYRNNFLLHLRLALLEMQNIIILVVIM